MAQCSRISSLSASAILLLTMLLTIDDAPSIMPLISAPLLGYHHAIPIFTQNVYLIPLVLCPRVQCLRDVRAVDSISSGATESSALGLHSSAIYARAYRVLHQSSQALRVICLWGCGSFSGWRCKRSLFRLQFTVEDTESRLQHQNTY